MNFAPFILQHSKATYFDTRQLAQGVSLRVYPAHQNALTSSCRFRTLTGINHANVLGMSYKQHKVLMILIVHLHIP